MIDLEDVISSNCYRKDGKINRHSANRTWWENKHCPEYYDEVVMYTSFLNKEAAWACRLWHIIHQKTDIMICEVCDNIAKWNSIKGKYNIFCSRRCSTLSKRVQDKIKATSLKKYGFHNASQSPLIQDKIKDTSLKKYGTVRPQQSAIVKEKTRNTNVKKYGMHPTQLHFNGDKIYDKEWLETELAKGSVSSIMAQIGCSTSYVYKKLNEHNVLLPRIYSCFEEELVVFLKQHVIDIKRNDRFCISPLELDIYLPDYKLAIECNGTYWHSENQGKIRNYHLNKTMLCKEQGIQLIHIWEHEWKSNRSLLQSRLCSKLGVNDVMYARKTHITEINSQDSSKFLNNNHIQGNCQASVKYGLYYDTELAALMTFGKSRYNKNIEWELIRYCSKQGINVVGGASKLFKHFIKNYNPDSIISYSDRMWNTGKLYNMLGFRFSHSSNPSYYYTTDYIQFDSRISYQKHKLKDKLAVFNSDLTEWENMQANGYDRIWDCGNDVWIWNKR